MKSDCQLARERLQQEMDGELRAEARRDLQAHLHICSHCSEIQRQWRALGMALAAPTPAPPEDLLARTLARVESLPVPVPLHRGDFRRRVIFWSVLTLLGLGVSLAPLRGHLQTLYLLVAEWRGEVLSITGENAEPLLALLLLSVAGLAAWLAWKLTPDVRPPGRRLAHH